MAERKPRGDSGMSKGGTPKADKKQSLPKTSYNKSNDTKVEKVVLPTQPPAATPESRENQLINYAVTLAEKQLLDGTASAAVITHYLKLGTSRERLEREILEKQSRLIDAKADSIVKAKDQEDVAARAIEAMRKYNKG